MRAVLHGFRAVYGINGGHLGRFHLHHDGDVSDQNLLALWAKQKRMIYLTTHSVHGVLIGIICLKTFMLFNHLFDDNLHSGVYLLGHSLHYPCYFCMRFAVKILDSTIRVNCIVVVF